MEAYLSLTLLTAFSTTTHASNYHKSHSPPPPLTHTPNIYTTKYISFFSFTPNLYPVFTTHTGNFPYTTNPPSTFYPYHPYVFYLHFTAHIAHVPYPFTAQMHSTYFIRPVLMVYL